jgi:voltage-gated potassium channel
MASRDVVAQPSVEESPATARQRAVAGAIEARAGVFITPLDRWCGPCMFWVSFLFLVIFAGCLCSLSLATTTVRQFVTTTAPGIVDPHSPASHDTAGKAASAEAALDSAGAEAVATAAGSTRPLLWALGLLYPVIVLEWVAHAVAGGRGWRRHLLYCLLPPARMGGRDHVDAGSVWLPHVGWARVDPSFQERIERAFSGPMILMALAVLPLLGFEWHLQSKAVTPSWETLVFLRLGESVIWLAFALEFIIMLAISSNRLRYCRDHWIDIVIILLPLVAFLRILRMGRLLRLHQVSRVGRAVRLRGIGLRMFRGVLLLDLFRHFVEGDPGKRLARLRKELAEREFEIEQLRSQIDRLEASVGAKDEQRSTGEDDG